jgi:hypothetical protein
MHPRRLRHCQHGTDAQAPYKLRGIVSISSTTAAMAAPTTTAMRVQS